MKFSTLEVLALTAVAVCVAMKYRRRKAVERAESQIVRGPRGSIPGLSGATPVYELMGSGLIPSAQPAAIDGPIRMNYEPNTSIVG